MHWQQSSDTGVPFVYNPLPRRRFKEIRKEKEINKYIHFANNTLLDKDDKMYKVRPYFEMLKQNFLQFSVIPDYL